VLYQGRRGHERRDVLLELVTSHRLEGALENLRKQHTWDLISDDELLREARQIKTSLAALPSQVQPIDDYRIPAQLIRDIASIVRSAIRTQRPDALKALQEFYSQVFARVRVDGKRIAEIELNPIYKELFAVGLSQKLVRRGAVKRTSPPAPPPVAFSGNSGAICLADIEWMIDMLAAA
jgi:hypothetical protein